MTCLSNRATTGQEGASSSFLFLASVSDPYRQLYLFRRLRPASLGIRDHTSGSINSITITTTRPHRTPQPQTTSRDNIESFSVHKQRFHGVLLRAKLGKESYRHDRMLDQHTRGETGLDDSKCEYISPFVNLVNQLSLATPSLPPICFGTIALRKC